MTIVKYLMTNRLPAPSQTEAERLQLQATFREVRASLVAVTVFKTVVRDDKSLAGGFDSHALPFFRYSYFRTYIFRTGQSVPARPQAPPTG